MPGDHGHEQHEHDQPDEHGEHRGHGHSHGPEGRIDQALESSEEGIRALKVSLVALAATAVAQLVVVMFTGSVALLGDTLHNFADALTAVPLWLAFWVGRRAPTRRYTYGYGRAEDVAGVVIVLAIIASAALAGYESLLRLLEPEPVRNLWAVAAAGVIGFLGNEAVAQYRMRVGRRIGSAALVADGHHARTDGFTSLAVLLGALGVALGWQRSDAVVGLLITVAILFVLRSAARDIWRRLMDAVDPGLVDRAEQVVRAVDGVEDIGDLRLRWVGHRLRAEVEVVVDADLSVIDGHAVATRTHHALLHELPKLHAALVHFSPCGHDGVDHHAELAHHRGSD